MTAKTAALENNDMARERAAICFWLLLQIPLGLPLLLCPWLLLGEVIRDDWAIGTTLFLVFCGFHGAAVLVSRSVARDYAKRVMEPLADGTEPMPPPSYLPLTALVCALALLWAIGMAALHPIRSVFWTCYAIYAITCLLAVAHAILFWKYWPWRTLFPKPAHVPAPAGPDKEELLRQEREHAQRERELEAERDRQIELVWNSDAESNLKTAEVERLQQLYQQKIDELRGVPP
jgi:hypothetical protein